MLKLPENLELAHEGIPIVRLTFGITLFMEQPFTAFPTELVRSFDRFREIVGDEELRNYASWTMKRHKKVTPRALTMIASWFEPDAKRAEGYGIEYQDAVPQNAAPTSRYEMLGSEEVDGERMESATMVRWVLPPTWGTDRSAAALELTKELCDLLPFRSGQAGFGFEVSRYFIEKGNEHALPLSMRHPGIDVHNRAAKECNAVRFDGVRGVGWLTMLDDAFIEQLGGPPELDLCEVIDVEGGIILKAGDAPAIGDVEDEDDLPAYREAFAYIEPLTEPTIEHSPWLTLKTDPGNRTEAWYKRFGR